MATTLTLEERIAANRPIHPTEVARIMLLLHSALDEMMRGSDEPAHFDRLAEAMNVGLIRSEQIGNAGVKVFLAAGDALMDADRMLGERGRYGFTGPTISHLRDGVALYEELLKASTPMQMYLAAVESAKRIQRGQVRTA